jgi:predicted SAM-dependent methyltransferase
MGQSMSALGQVVQRLPYSVRRVVERHRHALLVVKGLRGVHPRSCPICGYHGRFRAFGLPPQFDAQCGSCDALARHRLFVLMDGKHGILAKVKSLLHFAPEEALRGKFKARFEEYATADLLQRDVDHHCNIEQTGLPDQSFGAIFASHILEHVDDEKTLRELYRVLEPGGKLIAMVPIVEAWEATYENAAIQSGPERQKHFGQSDHVRWYGRDFSTRLAAAGFEVTAYTATPEECARHGLQPGEKVFVGVKPG